MLFPDASFLAWFQLAVPKARVMLNVEMLGVLPFMPEKDTGINHPDGAQHLGSAEPSRCLEQQQ